MNVERLVKHLHFTTDTGTKDRILGDAIGVLVESRRERETLSYLEHGGVLQIQGGMQVVAFGRLMKLAILAAAITVGVIVVQYIAFVFYLQIAYR